MTNSNSFTTIVDGMNSSTDKIDQDQALSLITRYNLKPESKSQEDCFQYSGKIKNLDLEIKYNRGKYKLILRGSLPKYLKGENISDVSWDEIEVVKAEINEMLHLEVFLISESKIEPYIQLDYNSFTLSRLELRADVTVGIDLNYMKPFLTTNLIQHKGQPFRCDDGLTYLCKHENYWLKVYIKGENILRFEMVFLTKELRKYKINNPCDILNEKLKPLGMRMKREFAEMVFGDGINIFTIPGISKKEELALLQMTNNWRNNCYKDTLQILNKKDGLKYKQRMYRLKSKCKTIFLDKGHGFKKILLDSLNQKIDSCFI